MSLSETGTKPTPLRSRFAFLAVGIVLLAAAGCSIFATRPVQEMSDTAASLRAAREVQADTLTPELFRQATEWFYKARKEYKFKNFKLAHDYAAKARKLAEQAEFESIRIGGNRTEVPSDPNAGLGVPPPPPPPPSAPEVAPTPYSYATPTPTPVDAYDQRHAQELQQKQNQPPPAPPQQLLTPTPIPITPPTTTFASPPPTQ